MERKKSPSSGCETWTLKGRLCGGGDAGSPRNSRATVSHANPMQAGGQSGSRQPQCPSTAEEIPKQAHMSPQATHPLPPPPAALTRVPGRGRAPSAAATATLLMQVAHVGTMYHQSQLRRKAQDHRTFGLGWVGLVFSVKQSYLAL